MVNRRQFITRTATIGAGALVQEDIPDHCVAYGIPAKVIRQREEGEKYL
jgi:acetyltransferase-like isoleucine patch superfamily enzyme